MEGWCKDVSRVNKGIFKEFAVSWKFGECFEGVSRVFHRSLKGTLRKLQRWFSEVLGVLQECFKEIKECFNCFNDVSWLFQGKFKYVLCVFKDVWIVLSVFHGCFKDVSSVFWRSCKDISRMLQRYWKASFKSVPRKFWGCFRELSTMCQKCFKVVSGCFEEVFFSNLVWHSSQLPEQKEALFFSKQPTGYDISL